MVIIYDFHHYLDDDGDDDVTCEGNRDEQPQHRLCNRKAGSTPQRPSFDCHHYWFYLFLHNFIMFIIVIGFYFFCHDFIMGWTWAPAVIVMITVLVIHLLEAL